MKLGILKCDSVREEYRDRFVDYPDMFIQMFKEVDADIEFEIFDLEQQQFPATIDLCDAFLITGSRFGAYEDNTWINTLHDFVRQLEENQIPTVGICFGHQLIANALGGRAEKSSKGWGIGVATVEVQNTTTWMQPALQQMSLLVSHQDQVVKIPEQAVCLAGNAFCPNAVLQIGKHMLSFQGHPEFSHEYVAVLMEMRKELLGAETYAKSKATLKTAVDRKIAAQWIVNFLRQNQ